MRDDLDDMGLRKGMGDFEEGEDLPPLMMHRRYVTVDEARELTRKPTLEELLKIEHAPQKLEEISPSITPPIDYPKPPDTDIQKLIGELKVMRCSDSFIKIDRVISMLEDL